MGILDLLFPRRCVSCGKLGSYFCHRCISQIEFITHPICPVCTKPAIDGMTHPSCRTPLELDGMLALGHYKGPIRKAIKLLKYKLVSDLAQDLVGILANHLPDTLPKFDYLTPVPLHPRRERERGFNQSELVAGILSKKLKVPIVTAVLRRIKYTKPQANLKGKEREKNIIGSFAVSQKEDIKDKIIGLVDDVATTRTTLFECAKVLKRAGAKIVWGIVLAHG